MLLGVVVGFMLTVAGRNLVQRIRSIRMSGGRGPTSTRADLYNREIFAPWPGAIESFGIFAGVLFNHNTLVGIMTFGLGMGSASRPSC